MECPDCRSTLVHETLTTLSCRSCGAAFWLRGAELVRKGEYEAPPVVSDDEAPPVQRRRRATPRDPRSAQGPAAGVCCPDCRAPLVLEQLSSLACPGCGIELWWRGGELVPRGDNDPVEAVATSGAGIPRAVARIRGRRDD